jgi:hypothetical protein
MGKLIKTLDSVPEGHDPEDSSEALKLVTDKEKIYMEILRRDRRSTLGETFEEIEDISKSKGTVDIDDLAQQFA